MENTPLKNLRVSITTDLLKCRSRKDMIAVWEAGLNAIMKCKSMSSNSETDIITENTVRDTVRHIRKAVGSKLDMSKSTHIKKDEWLLGKRDSANRQKREGFGLIKVDRDFAVKNNNNKIRNRNSALSKPKILADFNRLIDDLLIHRSSPDPSVLAVVIGVATGRRAIEIFKTGKFKRLDKKHLVFRGQAKTKKDVKMIIPCLIDSTLIIKLISSLREITSFPESMSNDDIHSKTRSGLNRKANSLIKDHMLNKHEFEGRRKDNRQKSVIKFHDTRKIYAQYCVKNLCGNDEKIKDEFDNVILNEREFMRAILGHERSETGLFYENWIVK